MRAYFLKQLVYMKSFIIIDKLKVLHPQTLKVTHIFLAILLVRLQARDLPMDSV